MAINVGLCNKLRWDFLQTRERRTGCNSGQFGIVHVIQFPIFCPYTICGRAMIERFSIRLLLSVSSLVMEDVLSVWHFSILSGSFMW